jgi:hypothetical protein
MDVEDKAAPWQPNPQCEPPGQRGQSFRKYSSLNRSRMIGGAEKRVSAASGHRVSTGSEVGSLAGCGCGSDDDGFERFLGGLGGPLDVHPRPISAPRCSGRTCRQLHLQRACRAHARPDVLADGAPLESRHRSAQGALLPAGRCRRPVPHKHAGHHMPVPVPVVAGSCQDLTTISPRHLNVVMVARLVQILGAQVTAACATRRAPYRRPPLPGGPSHPVT